MLLNLPPAVSVATLEQMRVAPPQGFDVYEDVLFDTVIYPAAGVGSLSFFQQTTADVTLTNVQPAGQIPAPHYFRAHRLFLDFLTTPTESGDQRGRLSDIDTVLNLARGVINFTAGATQRRRAAIPLRALGGIGGAQGSVSGGDASHIVEHGRNAPNGGFPFDTIIKHGESFSFDVRFAPGAPAAISADLPVQLAVYGWRYVPVSAGR